MLSAVLLLAAQPSDVVAGAVLTLVLPLGITLIVLAVWFFAIRRTRRE